MSLSQRLDEVSSLLLNNTSLALAVSLFAGKTRGSPTGSNLTRYIYIMRPFMHMQF